MKEQEFEKFIKGCANNINAVIKKIDILIEFKKEFDSDIYKDRIERLSFENAVDMILLKIAELRSQNKEKKK